MGTNKDPTGLHNRTTAINGPTDSWGVGHTGNLQQGKKPHTQEQVEVVEETRLAFWSTCL